MARLDADPGTFRLTCAGYTVACTPNGLPLTYTSLKSHAALTDEIALHEQSLCCITVRRDDESWPFLVVAQSYAPHGGGFEPGALLVPDTRLLFIGAGERVLAYRLEPPAKLWEDSADIGFLGWAQHGDTVVLSAELELAAWDTTGRKLWTTIVEPPWDYRVEGDTLTLDVMGEIQSFDLRQGPPNRS